MQAYREYKSELTKAYRCAWANSPGHGQLPGGVLVYPSSMLKTFQVPTLALDTSNTVDC